MGSGLHRDGCRDRREVRKTRQENDSMTGRERMGRVRKKARGKKKFTPWQHNESSTSCCFPFQFQMRQPVGSEIGVLRPFNGSLMRPFITATSSPIFGSGVARMVLTHKEQSRFRKKIQNN